MGPHEKIKPLNYGLDEREESQVGGIDQIFNKIIEENCPRTKGRHSYRYKRHTDHLTDNSQIRKFLQHVKVKIS